MQRNQPPQHTPNLQRAHQLLGQYINDTTFWAGFKRLNAKRQASLMNIYSQLNLLFSQKGWLRHDGLIAKYYLKRDNGEEAIPPTQQQLIDEALEVDHSTRVFTLGVLEQAKIILIELFTPGLPDHLTDILKFVDSSVKEALENVQAQIFSDNNLKKVLEKTPVMLARQMKIPFILTRQEHDPLRDKKSDGDCYGHMMMWRDNVSLNSTPSTSLFRANPNSSQYQENQAPRASIDKKVFSSQLPIRQIIHKTIMELSSENIYALDFWFTDLFNNKNVGHSLGIRRFDNECYEVLDSNYGIFVCQNALQLEIWLTSLIRYYTYNNIMENEGKLALYPIGKQPPNAVPSIPTLKEEAVIPYPSQSSQLAMQLSLYTRLKTEPIDENEIKRLTDLEIKELRDAVISQIDLEIEFLQKEHEDKSQHTTNDEVIHYLQILKENIHQAEPSKVLSAVINTWLESMPSEKMNEHTRTFIYRLEANGEINNYHLNYLRASVINKLGEMVFNGHWENLGKVSPGIELLQKAFEEYEKNPTKTFREFLMEVKRIGVFNTPSYGSDKYFNQHEALTDFYKSLSRIDPDNRHMLRYQDDKLSRIYDNFLMAPEPAPSVSVHIAPPSPQR